MAGHISITLGLLLGFLSYFVFPNMQCLSYSLFCLMDGKEFQEIESILIIKRAFVCVPMDRLS